MGRQPQHESSPLVQLPTAAQELVQHANALIVRCLAEAASAVRIYEGDEHLVACAHAERAHLRVQPVHGVEQREPLQLVDRARVLLHRIDERRELLGGVLHLRLFPQGLRLDGAEHHVPAVEREPEQLVAPVHVLRELLLRAVPVCKLLLQVGDPRVQHRNLVEVRLAFEQRLRVDAPAPTLDVLVVDVHGVQQLRAQQLQHARKVARCGGQPQ